MSVKLASRNKSPVGGFQFTQRETKWESAKADPTSLWDFNALVSAVIQHRRANPKFRLETDRKKVEDELDDFNARRMQRIPGAESYIVQGGSQVFHLPQASLASRLKGANAAAANVRAGIGMMMELFGEGLEPVPHELAEKRAAICVSCPLNNKASLLENLFTVPAVAVIQKQLEIRGDLNLSTSQDAKLNICDGCFCVLKLAVHVPIEQKLKHLTDEAKAKLDGRCWQLLEAKS